MNQYKLVSEDNDRRKKYEYEHKGTTYVLETAWRRVVDDYDEYLGSVELDHIELSGYNTVIDYREYPNKSDFTWLPEEDTIFLKIDPIVKQISLNSQNIEYTRLFLNRKIYFDITQNSSFLQMAKGLKKFIEKHQENIQVLTFKNVQNPICKAWITSICRTANIDVTFDKNIEAEKVYTHKKR